MTSTDHLPTDPTDLTTHRSRLTLTGGEPPRDRRPGRRPSHPHRGRDARLVPRLRDERHRGSRAAGRPRRPQAGAPPDPVHDGRDGALGHELLPQVRGHRRRGDGQVPPARRRRPVRRAGPAGPGLLHALPAGRRAGQLRLGRRRLRRRDAVHGGTAHRDLRGDARRHRQEHRRLRGQLRRHPEGADGPAGQAAEPADQRLLRHRGRHGDQHPAPPPGRGGRRHDRLHRRPVDHQRRPVRPGQGPGLPDRRLDLPLRDAPQPAHRRAGDDRRHPRDVRPRPRARRDAGAGRVRGDPPRPDGDHRHRAAVPGEQGDPAREDRRAGQGQEDRRHRRPARRVGPRRDAHLHRDQAGRQPAQGAEQPVQAHGAPDDVQPQHARARRRPAADAAAQERDRPLRRAPARDRPAAHRVRPREGPRPGPHPRGPQDRPRQPRRGDRTHPRVGGHAHGARPAS